VSALDTTPGRVVGRHEARELASIGGKHRGGIAVDAQHHHGTPDRAVGADHRVCNWSAVAFDSDSYPLRIGEGHRE